MEKEYNLNKKPLFIKDEKSVKYHLSQDDYFGTIATILSLIRQQAENEKSKLPQEFFKTLNNLEKDLVFLQKNYQISPRIKKRKSIPKGIEKNQ